MPELDSLRGIAILLVLLLHGFSFSTARLSGLARVWVRATYTGWTGVNLFFVLSGFLITGILLDSRCKPGYYKRFYLRRALRILPLYYLVLLALYPLSHIGALGARDIGWRFVALSFVYLSNLVAFFGVSSQYGVLWSLAVEEQFYIVWPAMVRLFSRRGIVCVSGLIIAGCPLLRAVAFKLGYTYWAGYPWLVADGLACGALLAALSRGMLVGRKSMLSFALACLAASAVMFFAGVRYGLTSSTLLGGSLRLTALDFLFTGGLSATLLIGTSSFSWAVHRPVLQFFGWISYGLYLVHMLAFDFVDHCIAHYFPAMLTAIGGDFTLMVLRFSLGASLAIAVAFLSRKYFEEHFLRLKSRWEAPAKPTGEDSCAEPLLLAVSESEALAEGSR